MEDLDEGIVKLNSSTPEGETAYLSHSFKNLNKGMVVFLLDIRGNNYLNEITDDQKSEIMDYFKNIDGIDLDDLMEDTRDEFRDELDKVDIFSSSADFMDYLNAIALQSLLINRGL